MIDKRGYSFGPTKPYHAEERAGGWAVFDARDDKDLLTGMSRGAALSAASKLNFPEGCNPFAADSVA